MTRMIVTADDFGLCREVNEAVCLLHDRGLVQRTSLLVTTGLFAESVEALRTRPGLAIAIHLDLTDGRPVLPAATVPTLVGGDGGFRGGRHYSVALGVMFGSIARQQIHAEWRAQILKARQAGLSIVQLNGHGHVHLLPRLRNVVLDLVEEFAIPEMRIVALKASARGFALGLCSLGIQAAARRRHLRLRFPDQVFGLRYSGALDEERLLSELSEAARREFVELVVHPATARNPFHDRWGYSGERETRALLSEAFGQRFRELSRT